MTDTHSLNNWPQPYRLPDAAPYWAALSEDRLTYQHCNDCAQAVWPAHSFCTHCGSRSLDWRQSSGRGAVWSFSTVMRGPTPVWAAIVPYTVGFIQMDEGYFLFSQIEADPEAIAIGQRVTVRFTQRGEQKLPLFVPADR